MVRAAAKEAQAKVLIAAANAAVARARTAANQARAEARVAAEQAALGASEAAQAITYMLEEYSDEYVCWAMATLRASEQAREDTIREVEVELS